MRSVVNVIPESPDTNVGALTDQELVALCDRLSAEFSIPPQDIYEYVLLDTRERCLRMACELRRAGWAHAAIMDLMAIGELEGVHRLFEGSLAGALYTIGERLREVRRSIIADYLPKWVGGGGGARS